jgi:hypothetical protein
MKKDMPSWDVWTVVDGKPLRTRVKAWTKSEARAQLKKQFGLPRLPVGSNVSRAP